MHSSELDRQAANISPVESFTNVFEACEAPDTQASKYSPRVQEKQWQRPESAQKADLEPGSAVTYEDTIDCPICLEPCCRPVHISVGCGHVVCRLCAFHTLRSATKGCPLCRAPPVLEFTLGLLFPSDLPFDERLDAAARAADPIAYAKNSAKEDAHNTRLRQNVIRELPLLRLQACEDEDPRRGTHRKFFARLERGRSLTLYFHNVFDDKQATLFAEVFGAKPRRTLLEHSSGRTTVGLLNGRGTGQLARLVSGTFTDSKRTTFKARIECLEDTFQLLDELEVSETEPLSSPRLLSQRPNVQLLPLATGAASRRGWGWLW